ncbi:MAG: phosphate ABC transporter ATP-binding protein [Actinomycetota bacterium]|nr:phosphate ABC transporter ATP-binding protein [Actinomycetota bacterium]
MTTQPHAIQPALVFEDVVIERAGRRVLDAVRGQIPEGQVTVIAGPSGVGKTTLLRLCNRLEVPDQGRILYRGRDIADLDPLRLRREVGMVFQTPALFGGTVRDNLAVADPHGGSDTYADALRRVSLDPTLLDRQAGSLSGGEAQRVCLARTLITGPQVLLADEPTSGLDLTPRLAFERLIRGLANDGLTVVWVTHDLDQLRRLADHVLVLLAGRVPYSGPPDSLNHISELARFLAGDPDATR